MRLAARNLPAGADTALYTVPVDQRAVFTVSLCCRLAAAKIRLALTDDGAAPTDADWIEYDTGLQPFAVLERTGLALAAGQNLYARADVAGVSAVVFGIQEAK